MIETCCLIIKTVTESVCGHDIKYEQYIGSMGGYTFDFGTEFTLCASLQVLFQAGPGSVTFATEAIQWRLRDLPAQASNKATSTLENTHNLSLA